MLSFSYNQKENFENEFGGCLFFFSPLWKAHVMHFLFGTS